MNPLDEFQQWNNEIHAAGRATTDESVGVELCTRLNVMIDYRIRQMQTATVRRLNNLTPEHNGRVHAGAVDAEAAKLCSNDTAHGPGTVVFVICGGDLIELCGDCGVAAVRDQTELKDGPDHIDVEVYR